MKNIYILLATLLVNSNAFAQKYWEQANVSSSYSVAENYKVAILPVKMQDMELQKEAQLKSTAAKKTEAELMGVKNLSLVPIDAVKTACQTYAFGGGDISFANYADIAKNVGADVICTIELSKEKMTIKGKEIGTVMAYIQLLDVSNNMMVLYTGKARSMNPISLEAEAELAIENALRRLKKVK
jgi:hypothetical protein